MVLEAAFSEAARERAQGLVASFEQFIQEYKDEITALQVLYSKPYAQRGGAGKVYQVFGKELDRLLDELNEVLAA